MQIQYTGDTILFRDGSTTVLTIRESSAQDAVQLQLEGQLRSETAHVLEDELVAIATMGGNVRLDLEKVTFITASVMGVLLNVQKKMDALRRGSLCLCSLPDDIYDELERVGLTDLLQIEE